MAANLKMKLIPAPRFKVVVPPMLLAASGRPSDYINVTWPPYRARGDGVTDDSDAIRDALLAGAGKTVFFPAGTYLVSKDGSNSYALSVPTGTKILGAGRHASVVSLAASQDCNLFSVVAQSDGVEFASIGIDGNWGSQTDGAGSGIIIGAGFTNATIRDCRIVECSNAGIYAVQSLTPQSSGLRIVDNDVYNCWLHNIWVAISSDGLNWCEDILIEGNTCDQAGGANIAAVGKRMSILGNTCNHAGNGENPTVAGGITAYFFSNGIDYCITGNRIHNSGQHGIHSGGNRVTITGNEVYNSGAWGIIYGETTGAHPTGPDSAAIVTISGNTVSTSVNFGIEVRDCTNANITGNTIFNSGDSGINVETGLTSGSITGNTIQTCGDMGIQMASPIGVSVTGNTINDCDDDGIFANGTGTLLTISGNLVYQNGGYGVNIASNNVDAVTVTGNTFAQNTLGTISGPTQSTSTYFGNQTDETNALTAATALDLPKGIDFFIVTGSTNVTSISSAAQANGRQVTFIGDGSAAFDFVDGNNLRLTANVNITMGPNDTCVLRCMSNVWYEISRSAN